MYVCLHVSVHVTHVCIFNCVYVCTYVCIRIRTCVYVCICIRTCVYIHMYYVCTYVYLCACQCIMCTCKHVYMYVYDYVILMYAYILVKKNFVDFYIPCLLVIVIIIHLGKLSAANMRRWFITVQQSIKMHITHHFNHSNKHLVFIQGQYL